MLSSHVTGGESRPEFPMLLARERHQYDGQFFRNSRLGQALDLGHQRHTSFRIPSLHLRASRVLRCGESYHELKTNGNAWFILASIIGGDGVLVHGKPVPEITSDRNVEDSRWIVINCEDPQDSARVACDQKRLYPRAYVCVRASNVDEFIDGDYLVYQEGETEETVYASQRLVNVYSTLSSFEVK